MMTTKVTTLSAVKLESNFQLSDMNMWMSALPLGKQQRIRRFLRPEDAQRALTADLLSRVMLCTALGVTNDQLNIAIDRNGKPYLHNGPNVHFNYSHSRKWVTCALSSAPVGIDVEEIQQEVDLRIAEHFFSAQECIDLHACGEQEKVDYFYNLWTLKESYIKTSGVGLSLPLSSFTIRKLHEEIVIDTQEDLSPVYFKQYFLDCEHKLSVCGQLDAFSESVQIINYDDLYQQFAAYL